MITVNYKVVSIRAATSDEKRENNTQMNAQAYLATIELYKESAPLGLVFVTGHLFVQDHPQIGDSYTLTFQKDEK